MQAGIAPTGLAAALHHAAALIAAPTALSSLSDNSSQPSDAEKSESERFMPISPASFTISSRLICSRALGQFCVAETFSRNCFTFCVIYSPPIRYCAFQNISCVVMKCLIHYTHHSKSCQASKYIGASRCVRPDLTPARAHNIMLLLSTSINSRIAPAHCRAMCRPKEQHNMNILVLTPVPRAPTA